MQALWNDPCAGSEKDAVSTRFTPEFPTWEAKDLLSRAGMRSPKLPQPHAPNQGKSNLQCFLILQYLILLGWKAKHARHMPGYILATSFQLTFPCWAKRNWSPPWGYHVQRLAALIAPLPPDWSRDPWSLYWSIGVDDGQFGSMVHEITEMTCECHFGCFMMPLKLVGDMGNTLQRL